VLENVTFSALLWLGFDGCRAEFAKPLLGKNSRVRTLILPSALRQIAPKADRPLPAPMLPSARKVRFAPHVGRRDQLWNFPRADIEGHDTGGRSCANNRPFGVSRPDDNRSNQGQTFAA
jgi:hypothetical protein